MYRISNFVAMIALVAGLVSAVPALAATTPAERFAAMDTNHDGVLSQEEFRAGYPDADPSLFTALDRNRDGVIEPAEYGLNQTPSQSGQGYGQSGQGWGMGSGGRGGMGGGMMGGSGGGMGRGMGY